MSSSFNTPSCYNPKEVLRSSTAPTQQSGLYFPGRNPEPELYRSEEALLQQLGRGILDYGPTTANWDIERQQAFNRNYRGDIRAETDVTYGSEVEERSVHEPPWNALAHQFDPMRAIPRATTESMHIIIPT